MEGLQRIALLTHAEELDRLAGDMPHRKRRTTPGVAIDLGQHHAGQRQCIAERTGGVRRILTGHGVDHEQRFRRLDRRVNSLNLGHHLGVDRQPTSGIDQYHVNELELGFADRGLSDIHRFLAGVGGKKVTPTSPASVSSCLIAAGR